MNKLTLKFIALVGLASLSAATTSCDKKSDEAPAAPAAAASVAVAAASASAAPKASAKGPLKIAYSDWPGWTAFEIGIQKGWFKEAGVDTDFEWFEYTPSMDAF